MKYPRIAFLAFLLIGVWCAWRAGHHAANERWAMASAMGFMALLSGAGVNREFWR